MFSIIWAMACKASSIVFGVWLYKALVLDMFERMRISDTEALQ